MVIVIKMKPFDECFMFDLCLGLALMEFAIIVSLVTGSAAVSSTYFYILFALRNRKKPQREDEERFASAVIKSWWTH